MTLELENTMDQKEVENGAIERNSMDRLYHLLPVIYRQRDAEEGYPLQALLRVIAEQVNVVEDDIAQLYENWFIETCQEWVVPYIADLIGYRPVHEAGEPGEASTLQGQQRNKILIPRREVANTIRYRRRKGALALLEELARDTAGWPARAVEFFSLLSATQSLNQLQLGRARTADLHQVDSLERVNGPFDSLAHTANVRRINSPRTRGRTNIPSVGVFIWRLRPYSVTRSPAYCVDRVRNHYTFSILGNNSPLITKPVPETDPAHIAEEMNVPAWIRRRAFDDRTEDYYGPLKSLYIWRDGLDNPVPVENIVPADLSKWAYRPHGNQVAVDPRLGRIAFAPRSAPKTGVWVTYHYGFSAEVGGGEYDRPVRPPSGERLYRVSQNQDGKAGYGTINDALKAWRNDRPPEAAIEILDSGAYTEQIEVILEAGQRLEIRAADGTRPVIRLLDWYSNRPDAMRVVGLEGKCPPQEEPAPQAEPVKGGRKPYRQSSPVPSAAESPGLSASSPPAEELPAPRLSLDGLLITGRSVVVSGKMDCVAIRHCTLVPGWSLDPQCEPEHETEPSLELADTCATVTVEHSILGTIVISQDEVETEPLKIGITDSILDAANPELPALSDPDGRLAHAILTIRRSTVIGQVLVHAIELAENSIFNQLVQVARSQVGCMRFCYVPQGSRTPRRFNCQPDLVVQAVPGGASQDLRREAERLRVRPQFNSLRYGTPTYCQLALCCAEEIRRGASDESEMGVFHDLFQPQREANLRARLDEYTPAGMDAGILFET